VDRVAVNGLSLAVHEWPGTGPAIVCIHGLCLMTREEAAAMAAAIPRSRLVVVPKTNHYTVLLGKNPRVKSAMRAFLGGT
jgi:hypothetical protein